MSLKCTINKTVLIKQFPIFILVQLQQKQGELQLSNPNNLSSYPLKYRTQLSIGNTRPKFNKNQFVFQLFKGLKSIQNMSNNVYNLKLGLMLMATDEFGKIIQQKYQQARPIAFTSINLSITRLRQIGLTPQKKYYDLINPKNKKAFGKFQLTLEFIQKPLTNLNQQMLLGKNNELEIQRKVLEKVQFTPIMQWIMFDQNSHDPLREKTCIQALDKQSHILYSKLHQSKSTEERLESLFHELEKDQQQLRKQLQALERMNNKISQKLSQKQSLECLQLQIQMLKGTKQGKGLLLQKVQYLQDRIYKQQDMKQKLILQYQSMKPQIQKKLSQSQQISLKLKGKEQQQFMIKNNTSILQSYDQVLYEYKSNEQVIQSLVKMAQAGNNQYTRQQAKLFLSQVNYQISMESYDISKNDNIRKEEQRLLQMIETQMQHTKISQEVMYSQHQGNQQQQNFILQVKIDSLDQQISNIKCKIANVNAKTNTSSNKSFIKNQSFTSNYNNYNPSQYNNSSIKQQAKTAASKTNFYKN